MGETGRMTVKGECGEGKKLLLIREPAVETEGTASAGEFVEERLALPELDPFVGSESRCYWNRIGHDRLVVESIPVPGRVSRMMARTTLRRKALAGACVALSMATSCEKRDAPLDFGRTPGPAELAHLSPESFSRTAAHGYEESRCADGAGILITPTAIGPAKIGTRIAALRKSCVTRRAGSAMSGELLISPGGGEIALTVTGRDSVVVRAQTAHPAFRTENGIGVGTTMRELHESYGAGCIGADSSVTFSALPRIRFYGAIAITRIAAGDSASCH